MHLLLQELLYIYLCTILVVDLDINNNNNIKIWPIVSSENSDNFRLTPKQKQHNTTTKDNNYNELMH